MMQINRFFEVLNSISVDVSARPFRLVIKRGSIFTLGKFEFLRVYGCYILVFQFYSKMCDTPFKTPNFTSRYERMKSRASDSEESIANSEDSSGSVELSIVAEFDDLIRSVKQKRNDHLLDAFTNFAEQTKLLWELYNSAMKECTRLQAALDHQTEDYTEVNRSLTVARKMLDDEKRRGNKHSKKYLK